MKEAKVIKAFTDRNTGHSFEKGDTYTGTDERVAELQASKRLGKATDGVQTDERPGTGAAEG